MASLKIFLCYRALGMAAFLASMPFGSSAQYNIQSMETKVLRKLIDPDGYDRQIRPAAPHRYSSEHNPLGVQVDVSLRSLQNFDVQTMDFTVNLAVGLKWIDNRLTYDHTIPYLTLTEPYRIWKPDIVISNAKRVSRDNGEDLFTRIYPSGAVHHKRMLTVVATCSMHLKYFPFDEQKCELIFSSFLYTNDILTFNWSTEHPIDAIEAIVTNGYDLTQIKGEECAITTNEGDHSCVKLVFSFERKSGNTLIRVFIPCVMFVFVSWVALWINSEQTLLRLLIPLITLMAMASNLSSMTEVDIPRTSYTKAVDVWTGICLSFVFALLLEVAIVEYLRRNDGDKDEPSASQEDDKISGIQPLEIEDGRIEKISTKPSSSSSSFFTSVKNTFTKPMASGDRVDILSRLGFPVAFAVFIVFYLSCVA